MIFERIVYFNDKIFVLNTQIYQIFDVKRCINLCNSKFLKDSLYKNSINKTKQSKDKPKCKKILSDEFHCYDRLKCLNNNNKKKQSENGCGQNNLTFSLLKYSIFFS